MKVIYLLICSFILEVVLAVVKKLRKTSCLQQHQEPMTDNIQSTLCEPSNLFFIYILNLEVFKWPIEICLASALAGEFRILAGCTLCSAETFQISQVSFVSRSLEERGQDRGPWTLSCRRKTLANDVKSLLWHHKRYIFHYKCQEKGALLTMLDGRCFSRDENVQNLSASRCLCRSPPFSTVTLSWLSSYGQIWARYFSDDELFMHATNTVKGAFSCCMIVYER